MVITLLCLHEATHLFLGSEVVHNVEELADLFRSLTLDHVSNRLAADVAKRIEEDKPRVATSNKDIALTAKA